MDANALTRELNDSLRKTFTGGQIALTSYVASMEPEDQEALLEKVRSFEDFTPDNDPYQEHDFGKINLNGKSFFWKIDYYDKNLEYASPDPSNPKKTVRVLTVMHTEEY